MQLGLFATEKEGEYALLKAIQNLKTPCQLRLLFVHLLINNTHAHMRKSHAPSFTQSHTATS